ncbi:hypothetical protein K438DRAFT_1205063 [Mycena galopus ATCC 62051]|nr:hypothetical protein K438DRAFT_1205063 [Mycena galopus ATCC 62051]
MPVQPSQPKICRQPLPLHRYRHLSYRYLDLRRPLILLWIIILPLQFPRSVLPSGPAVTSITSFPPPTNSFLRAVDLSRLFESEFLLSPNAPLSSLPSDVSASTSFVLRPFALRPLAPHGATTVSTSPPSIIFALSRPSPRQSSSRLASHSFRGPSFKFGSRCRSTGCPLFDIFPFPIDLFPPRIVLAYHLSDSLPSTFPL